MIDVGAGVAFSNNERNQVVGYTNAARGAILWDRGILTRLGTILGGGFSRKLDINNRTQIVGWSDTAFNTSRAFLWEDGTLTDIGTFGGDAGFSIANAINDRGQVAGVASTTTPGHNHAFLWERGTIRDLGTLPGGTSSEAVAINRRGQVAGNSDSSTGGSAFLWENGTMVDLRIAGLGGLQSLNNRGEVVGQHTTSSGENDRRALDHPPPSSQ